MPTARYSIILEGARIRIQLVTHPLLPPRRPCIRALVHVRGGCTHTSVPSRSGRGAAVARPGALEECVNTRHTISSTDLPTSLCEVSGTLYTFSFSFLFVLCFTVLPPRTRVPRRTPSSIAPSTFPRSTQCLPSTDTVLMRHAVNEITVDTVRRSSRQMLPPSYQARISLVIAPYLSLFGRLVLLDVSSLLVPSSLACAQPLRRYSRFCG
ncbi:hypothetical protein M404DRAFT_650418 [Pisolithus tinctorius Marx 270]|uniref:Uncharacterized protein n=1 Tax=Pisolithus tinctorius Marx 270 TaxID=870435 RepID=A0A0C3JYQ4_PISTI|nr:hypothetical protein M404DRAFT_650418 [Pisolithus tinctorius Marx 270]